MVLDERLQKRIQLAVVGAIAVLFILVVTLVFLIASRHSHASQQYALENQILEMQQRVVEIGRDIDFIDNDRFLEEYILFQLGFGRPGQTVTWR